MSLVRSEQDECSAVWQITACPALRPTAREQVVHLRACLNRMLQAEQAQRGAGGGSAASVDLLQLLDCAPPAELDRQYSALHAIFTAGLHELARQVAINCVERGELLTSLWASSEAIKARLLQRKAHSLRPQAALAGSSWRERRAGERQQAEELCHVSTELQLRRYHMTC